ncbi:MAG: hypothetical protein U0169_27025 [Polyangiaceae bacterium]
MHSFALYPPREASLAIAFVSWWGLHVAPKASRPRAAFFVGGLLFALSVYADPYALLFVPATFALVAFATRESGLRSGAFALVGALVGTIPTIVLWRRPEAAHGTASLSFDVLAHNWAIFRDVAFPWGTSAVAYAKGEHVLAWEVHPFGFGFRVVQVVGAVLFVGLTIAGGVLAFAKTTTSEVRRLGVTGLVLFVSTIGGFLVSRMVMDLFSTRYLAALVLAVPLAWAPVLAKLGLDRTFALAAPYVVASAVAGWVAFSPFVDGPRWVHAQASRDERELADILASKRVTIGVADYWTAYRFAFLADERVKLVPIHAREDRYAPWRGEFGSALSFVYVFDPERSRESFEEQRSGWLSGAARYELLHVGSLRAVIVDRNPHRPEGHSP